VQRIHNQFWRKWSSEYLQYLQECGKWHVIIDNVRVGQLDLLRDDHYPQMKWPLGRITEVYASRNGLIRVVTMKTAINTLRRHAARICILSLDLRRAALRNTFVTLRWR
jgi:hypothetical protein